MGAGVSRVDDTQLVSLCRERKELIKAAGDSRYFLAKAHVLYFQSLLDLCNALEQFVEEELVVVADSSEDENYIDDNSNTNSQPIKPLSSETSSSIHQRPRFAPMTMKGLTLQCFKPVYDHNGDSVDGTALRTLKDASTSNHHGYDHSSKASIEIPYAEVRSLQRGASFSFGLAVDMEDNIASLSEELSAPGTCPSAPPLPSSVHRWDFLGLFDVTDYVDFNYYNQGIDDIEPSELSVLREREGIPPLEEESKQIGVRQVPEGRKIKARGDNVSGSFKEATTPKTNKGLKKATDNLAANGSVYLEDVTQRGCKIRDVRDQSSEDIANQETSSGPKDEVIKEDDSLGSKRFSADLACGSKDLRVVVKVISKISEAAFNNAKQVSALLEATTLPYHPLAAKFKEFTSRILRRISSRGSIDWIPNRSIPTFTAPLMTKAAEIHEEHSNTKSGSLSSTLEKLYAWEKKLYEEVMVEEKLQQVYDRECRVLRKLDDRGAEASKIDSIHASIKKLRPEIKVAITAVDAISRQIQKLRDEELQIQLSEIIEGFTSMWTFLLKCLNEQLAAIRGSKSCLHIAEADTRYSTSFKATQKLEAEVLKFSKSLADYINSQKDFVKVLNEWLLRCISQSSEESNEGTKKFSPAKIGAPPIFTICNDWHHSIETVPEDEITKAIQDFASSLRHLKEMQLEEARQRVRTEQLCKVFEGQTRDFHDNASLSGECSVDEGSEEIVSMKKALYEERQRHGELVRELNDTVSVCLQASLVPVFETLVRFCLESLKAYKSIRLPNRFPK